jgi:hypothetical protein
LPLVYETPHSQINGNQLVNISIKLHNEELHNLYSSPSIIRMIKPRRMRWAEYVARMGEEECIKDIGGKARRKETTRKTKT